MSVRARSVRAIAAVALALGMLLIASPASAASSLIVYFPANGTTQASLPYTQPDGTVVRYTTIEGSWVPQGAPRSDYLTAIIDGVTLKEPAWTAKQPAGTLLFMGQNGDNWVFHPSSQAMAACGIPFRGLHHIVMEQRSASGAVLARSSTLTMTFDGPAASPTPTSSPTPKPIASPTPSSLAAVARDDGTAQTSRLGSGQADAPSFLRAIPTVQTLGLTPVRALTTAALTVILLVLIGFPGQLIGSTLRENYDRLFGWAAPLAARLKRASASVNRLPRWAVTAIGITLASVISGFIDPQFGFNPGSVRVLLEVAVALALQSVLGGWIVGRVVRHRSPELAPVVEFKLLSLVIVVIAVVVSRLTGFEPGIVFGLVVGLNFGAVLTATNKARVALVGSAYALALGILGWIGYSIAVIAFGAHPGVGGSFAIETLSGLAVAGIATLPISLLPVQFLEGGDLFSWRRWVWALCYAVGLFAFLVILLPLPFSWGSVHTPLVVWAALYVAYCLVAVGLWALLRLRRRPASE
ncbi:MAG TPA: hypothetical protein VIJ11_07140 [Galbitalea sp.]